MSSTLPSAQFKNMRAPLDRGVPVFLAIDGGDPPVFESEASFLQRLGLLGEDEAAQLTAEDFLPERIATD